MILYPAIGDLMKLVDSRYTLVCEVSKRARQLTLGAKPLAQIDTNKDVTTAVQEVMDGKVKYVRVREGIK